MGRLRCVSQLCHQLIERQCSTSTIASPVGFLPSHRDQRYILRTLFRAARRPLHGTIRVALAGAALRRNRPASRPDTAMGSSHLVLKQADSLVSP